MTPAQQIRRLETVAEYVELCRKSILNARDSDGWRRNALHYVTKAQAELDKMLSTPPLVPMTEREAVEVATVTIRETTRPDQLGRVVAERTRQGLR